MAGGFDTKIDNPFNFSTSLGFGNATPSNSRTSSSAFKWSDLANIIKGGLEGVGALLSGIGDLKIKTKTGNAVEGGYIIPAGFSTEKTQLASGQNYTTIAILGIGALIIIVLVARKK